MARGLQNSEAEPDPARESSPKHIEAWLSVREDSSESAEAGVSPEEDPQAEFTLIAESDLPPVVMNYITGTAAARRGAQSPMNRPLIRVRRSLPSLSLSLPQSRGIVLRFFSR